MRFIVFVLAFVFVLDPLFAQGIVLDQAPEPSFWDTISGIVNWIGNNEILVGVIGVALMPVIGAIPVVGAPLAILLAKVGPLLIPTLKQVTKDVESEKQYRTVREAASVVVGRLADNPENPVGQVPLAKFVAHAGAIGLVMRNRAK